MNKIWNFQKVFIWILNWNFQSSFGHAKWQIQGGFIIVLLPYWTRRVSKQAAAWFLPPLAFLGLKQFAGKHRDLVSICALGGIAPTVFEIVGASTYGIWWIFVTYPSICVRKNMKTVSSIVFPWQKLKSSTQNLKIPTRPWNRNGKTSGLTERGVSWNHVRKQRSPNEYTLWIT